MLYNKFMNKERRERARCGALQKVLPVLTAVILAATVLCALLHDAGAASSEPNYDYGLYTFEREMSVDGKTVSFYESGDEYFRYSHDADGYILIADRVNNTLTYAVSDAGAPVSSGVSAAADADAIAAVPKITRLDLSEEYIATAAYAATNASGLGVDIYASEGDVTVVNLVIFISFKGESYSPRSDLAAMLNGSGSVSSYYEIQSGGKIELQSELPYNGGAFYVYRDPNYRSYYNVDGNSVLRQSREAALLSAAVSGVKSYFDVSGAELDTDGDGYIDSVSFIVCGSSSNSWGSLLWPHSWNLDIIDGSGYSEIGGVKVGNYSLNFDTALDVGLLAHEMGHVLGAPDLYHYNDDYVPVGDWDIMHTDLDTPQYMLTYIRDKYLGGIDDGEIKDITSNGTYSLSPVTAAVHAGGTLAYRIYTDTNEYFMMEYRRVTASGFDSMLPGSGLIVYRIREPDDFASSEGNMNAVYHGSGSLADEVFVFRPDLSDSLSGNVYSRSAKEAKYAYMSPNNPYFSSIGDMTSTAKYDPDCLYFSNGNNSGIEISVNSISASGIDFTVRMAKSEQIPDQYFNGKITLTAAELVNLSEYSGLSATVRLGEFDTKYLSALTLEAFSSDGQVIASAKLNYGKFITAYEGGQRTLDAKFVVSDKGNDVDTLFDGGVLRTDSEPVGVRLRVTDSDGDVIELGTVAVSSANADWQTIVNTVTDRSPYIAAASGITVAVNAFGDVDVSGDAASGRYAAEGFSGAVSAAAGRTHTLVLTEGLRVVSFGSSVYGEQNVNNWEDIIAVSAGYYTSYGLTADGRVVACGLNNVGQTNVSGFSGIQAISAGLKHIVALKTDGTVMAAGSGSAYENLALIKNAVAVAAGDDFTAVLLKDGSVVTSGSNAPDTTGWNVKEIAAGSRHLLGLKEDGTVIAAGDNSYNQCGVAGLTDIESVAAGEFHSAFLREDGRVLFCGYGGEEKATSGIGNLKFPNYVSVEKISVSVAGGYSMPTGGVTTVSVATAPLNPTYSRMLFVSSDPEVLKVSATDYAEAVLTALKPGKAVLYVTALGAEGELTYSTEIEVIEPVPLTGIEFGNETVRIIRGESANLKLNIIPEDAFVTSDAVYYSSDESVAYAGTGGIITARSPGTAVITAVLDGFTAECTVVVVDSAEVTVEVVSSDNGAYMYGEALDMDRYTLVIDISGYTEYAALSADAVRGYSPYDVGVQTVYVDYMGATASFSVEVIDYVKAVSPSDTAPFKSSYIYGEALQTDALYNFDKIYASGRTERSTYLSSELTGYDPYVLGTQTLTFTYTDVIWGVQSSFNVNVDVLDYVAGISFTPLKALYKYGEELFGGELIKLNMASGLARYISVDEAEVMDLSTETSDPSDPLYSLYSLRTGAHVLRVTYTDTVTGEEHTASAQVNVETDGEYFFEGADAEGRFLYMVGGDLNIEIEFVQYNVVVVAERADSLQSIPSHGGIYYVLSGFDPSLIGVSEMTTVNIYAVNQHTSPEGETVTEPVLLGGWGITVYGYRESSEIRLVMDKTEYLFGEAVKGELQIVYDGETVSVPPMESVYDVTATGEVEYSARYMDTWYTVTVTINDYCVELMPINDISIPYGGTYTFEVTAVMASAGSVTLEPGAYSAEGELSATVPGTRTIRIGYGGKYTEFTLTVVNGVVRVELVEAPRTVYKLNETFDPSSRYEIFYASGDSETVYYDEKNFLSEPDSLSFSYVNETGIRVYIYYIGSGGRITVWTDVVTVPNYVTLISVKTSSASVKAGDMPDIEVRADYASGNFKMLKSDEYTLNYDPYALGEQLVTLKYVYKNETYTEKFTVTVVDAAASVTLVSVPAVTGYGYGAPINWTGAGVSVNYRMGGTATYTGADIAKFAEVSYSTLSTGLSKVRITFDGISVYFNITVGSEEYAVRVEDTEFSVVSLKERRIVLKKPGTADYAMASVVSRQSYLSAKYVSRDNETIEDYSSSASTGDKYILYNSDGVEVFVFKIFVNGDADGNGKVTQNDVNEIADILSGSGKEAYFDADWNGKQNLTDLVLFQREVSGTPMPAPSPSPLNRLAELLVAPVSEKSKEETCAGN